MRSQSQRPRSPAVYRDAAFLAHCSESEASDWLRARPVSYSRVMGTPDTPPDSHVLEYILYRRNRPRIDLALAAHGRSRTVLTRVYKRAPLSTRGAACSNPSLFVGDSLHLGETDDPHLLWHIVRSGPLAELRAICENPHLPSEFYASLLESWRGDTNKRVDAANRLSDERFQQVVRFLALNPRTSTSREESEERYYLDGYSDYRYNAFFTKCWELATSVPVTQAWAEALANLYRTLVNPFDVYKDVEAVLERWRQPDEPEYSHMRYLRQTIAGRCMTLGPDSLKSTDRALRDAFYNTFDPDDPSIITLDWNEWLALDNYCFLEIRNNQKVWRSPRGRQRLRNLLWYKSKANSDLTDVGFFDAQEADYRVSHPEWFVTEVEAAESDFEPLSLEPFPSAAILPVSEHAQPASGRTVNPLWIAVAAFVGALLGRVLF